MSKVDWNDILSASEASVMLGKSPKYIYLLWRKDSELLLKNSVAMKGDVLLISREGYEHLKPLVKKGEDLVNTLNRYVVIIKNDNAIFNYPPNY